MCLCDGFGPLHSENTHFILASSSSTHSSPSLWAKIKDYDWESYSMLPSNPAQESHTTSDHMRDMCKAHTHPHNNMRFLCFPIKPNSGWLGNRNISDLFSHQKKMYKAVIACWGKLEKQYSLWISNNSLQCGYCDIQVLQKQHCLAEATVALQCVARWRATTHIMYWQQKKRINNKDGKRKGVIVGQTLLGFKDGS